MSRGVATWDDEASIEDVQVYCHGCKDTYPGLPAYWRHNCCEPESGETYR